MTATIADRWVLRRASHGDWRVECARCGRQPAGGASFPASLPAELYRRALEAQNWHCPHGGGPPARAG